MKSILLVALGGGIGSCIRYLLNRFIFWNSFPLATWIINITGSFLIGILFAYTLKNPENRWISLFLMTGLCGGFTTFSTFSLETLRLMQNHQYQLAFIYILSSVILALAATFLGFVIGK